jgi:hypothetical protein
MSFDESESLIDTAAGFVSQAISACRRSILSGTSLLWLPPGRCRLITGQTRANVPVSHERWRGASESVTAVKSDNENAEDCPYFLIKPDPRCPECAAIMVWRSAHRLDHHHQRGGDKGLGLRVGRSPLSHAGRAGCSPQDPHAATQGMGEEETVLTR